MGAGSSAKLSVEDVSSLFTESIISVQNQCINRAMCEQVIRQEGGKLRLINSTFLVQCDANTTCLAQTTVLNNIYQRFAETIAAKLTADFGLRIPFQGGSDTELSVSSILNIVTRIQNNIINQCDSVVQAKQTFEFLQGAEVTIENVNAVVGGTGTVNCVFDQNNEVQFVQDVTKDINAMLDVTEGLTGAALMGIMIAVAVVVVGVVILVVVLKVIPEKRKQEAEKKKEKKGEKKKEEKKKEKEKEKEK